MVSRQFITALFLGALAVPVSAGVLFYGDEDCLNQGCYGATDPTAGATLQGLGAGTVTLSSTGFEHGFPFSPDPTDFPGTDQIFVGSVQTGSDDGYSSSAQRINGPAVFILDYSSLIGSGQTVTSITLGIAADDFQFPAIGNPFTATVNGIANAPLSTQLNSFNETGPVVQFFTIGLDPATDNASHILTLSIDEGGDGGDGLCRGFLDSRNHHGVIGNTGTVGDDFGGRRDPAGGDAAAVLP
jgi:hypothetical protein